MEEVKEMFKQLQTDLNGTKDSLKEMETNITKNINKNIKEIVGNLQLKIQQLEEENASQERRLDTIERTQRQRNVVLFGVEEEERGYNDLVHKILQILNETMKVQCTVLEIQALRRIGRKGNNIRPVILTLTTLGKKIEVQKKWKNLQNSNYSIAEDYPPKVLEKRKALYEQAKIEKENGKKVLIKYDKLIILPTIPTESKTTRSTKRALSQTPPQTNIAIKTKHVTGATQAPKKNKISSYWVPSRPVAQRDLSDSCMADENDREITGLQQQQQ